MITSTAKAEHATIIIEITVDEILPDSIIEIILKFSRYIMETYRWGYVNVSNSIIKKDKATQFLFQIPMKTIPSEATIDKYRLMAKNAVEAKYNELKNPFDEWSVKA